jgi:hypothetical protein
MAAAIVQQQDPYAIRDATAYATQQSALQTLLDTYNMNLLTGQTNLLNTTRGLDTGLGNLASLIGSRGTRESGVAQRQFSKYGQDWLNTTNPMSQAMTDLYTQLGLDQGVVNKTYTDSIAQTATDKQNDILATANTIKTNT